MKLFLRNHETLQETQSGRRQNSGNIYALLISVENYEETNLSNLTSSKMDLLLMKKSLQEGVKVSDDNIRVLGENGRVTIKSMAHAMKDFSRMLGSEDTFLFYFSGHGKNGELIFSDHSIGLQSVINYIEKLPAKNKVLILDCCYAGSFSEILSKTICLEDTLDSFVGAGMAVLASSSADELSRLGPGADHSLFTGMVSTAFLSRQLIRKGKISLSSIAQYVRELMDTWNRQHPEKSQQPIIRTSIGGTIYFDVEDYRPYETKKIHFETPEYIVTSVKPLSSNQEKRLCAFVIPKEDDFENDIPCITKDIARQIRYEDVFSNRKSEKFFKNESAAAVWCYFGKDESDIKNSLHYAYSIWAHDKKMAQKYFRFNSNAYVKDGIYIFLNSSYEMLRSMRDDTMKPEDYEKDVKGLYYKIINYAEQYITCITEVFNHTVTMEQARKEYGPWMKEIFHLYYRLSDVPIAPDQLHDWVEEVFSLAGWVVDMALVMEDKNGSCEFDDRNRWLFKNAAEKYYESLEKLKDL